MDILARICWTTASASKYCEHRPEVVWYGGDTQDKDKGIAREAMSRWDYGRGRQSRWGELDTTEVDCRVSGDGCGGCAGRYKIRNHS